MFSKYLLPLTLAGAQLAFSQSLCDKYTTALLTDNTAANQYTLLQLVVNTVVIGNYTQPNVGITVPGILANAKFGGEDVMLLPYFNGCLKSSNRGRPTAINFLDGGGAASVIDGSLLQKTNTNQYELFTHLYEFFGTLLGCSLQGGPDFPAYDGQASMFEVHKFMGLDPNEVGYFISQVGAAAASFGVSNADVQTVAGLLAQTFNVRCAPAVALVRGDSEFQSICVAQECPLAPNAVCANYENNGVFPEPQPVNGPGCPVVSSSTTPYAYTTTPYPTGAWTKEPKPTGGNWDDQGNGNDYEGGKPEHDDGGKPQGGHGGRKPKACPVAHHHREV